MKKRTKIYNSILLLICISAVFTLSVNAFAKTNYGEDSSALETPGWHRVTSKKYYYVDSNGERAKKGWLTVAGKKYYIEKTGYRSRGLKKIKKKYYYFHKTKGYMVKGWKTINGSRYYFTKKKGYAKTGWLTVKGKTYHFGKLAKMDKGWNTIEEKTYYFDEKGVLQKNCFTPDGKYVDATGVLLQRSTLKKLLQTALQPVGQTLYVWGGAWNEEDTGAGVEAVTLGVSPQWKKFYDQNDSSYDYNQTRYQIHNGLDCSGYVGWTVYNTFNTSNGNEGFVTESEETANFAGKGWGIYAPAGSFSDYRAGDILSSSTHVYIALGQCKDSSLVLLHSSPPGVVICGTCTRDGKYNSEAAELARKYMQKYYPDWYSRYGSVTKGYSYLNSFSRMRWKIKGVSMMRDPDKYSKKTADQILLDLLGPL